MLELSTWFTIKHSAVKQGVPGLNFSVCQEWGAWTNMCELGLGCRRLHLIGKCNEKRTNCWIYKAQLQIISTLVVGLNWSVAN